MPAPSAPVILLWEMMTLVPLGLSAWIPGPVPVWLMTLPMHVACAVPISIPTPVPWPSATLPETELFIPPTTEKTWTGPVP